MENENPNFQQDNNPANTNPDSQKPTFTEAKEEIAEAQKDPIQIVKVEKKPKKRGLISLVFWFLLIFGITFIALNFSAFWSLGNYYYSVWSGTYESRQSEYTDKIRLEGEVRAEEGLDYIRENTVNEVANNIPPLNLEIMPPDNRVVIPKIDKNVPILKVDGSLLEERKWEELESEIQDKLKSGVVHYPHTAKPYQKGNVFLTGHSSYYPWDEGKYKDVFALLTVLQVGDEFIIYYDGKRYTYEIKERKEVTPDKVEVLKQDNEYTATLMTCTPPGTNLRRLILTADRISVD